jgi:hypothetical protein
MAGVLPIHEHGPVTFEVSAADAIVGGQLVESDSGSPAAVHVAGAGSILVIGVATNDAVGSSYSQTTTVPGTTAPTVNAALLTNYVAVAASGVYPLSYAASANFGQRLKAAANGTVTPFTGGETPNELVGICYEPAGVTVSSSAVVGAVRLAGLA